MLNARAESPQQGETAETALCGFWASTRKNKQLWSPDWIFPTQGMGLNTDTEHGVEIRIMESTVLKFMERTEQQIESRI